MSGMLLVQTWLGKLPQRSYEYWSMDQLKKFFNSSPALTSSFRRISQVINPLGEHRSSDSEISKPIFSALPPEVTV